MKKRALLLLSFILTIALIPRGTEATARADDMLTLTGTVFEISGYDRRYESAPLGLRLDSHLIMNDAESVSRYQGAVDESEIQIGTNTFNNALNLEGYLGKHVTVRGYLADGRTGFQLKYLILWVSEIIETSETPDGLGLTATDYNSLETFINNFDIISATYDCRKTTISTRMGYKITILEEILSNGTPVGSSTYPGETSQEHWNETDPLGRFNDHSGYKKWSEAQVTWILKNIMNCSEADISAMKADLAAKEDAYLLNGYYYIPIDGIGWEGGRRVSNVSRDGTYYTVKYLDYDYPGEYTGGGGVAVMSLKTIDGKKYWSIYYDGETPPSDSDFFDIHNSDWFAEPVRWAIEKNITNGTGKYSFSPDTTCTTAQILTFLWRAAGSPEPTGPNPFSDVNLGDYFYKSALWAYQSGLVGGPKLNGSAPCTRASTVDYLWKLSGSPSAGGSSFTDIPAGAPYAQAASWAVSKGVTNGTGNNQFSPDATCTRGQIVTFLYRWVNL